MSLQGLATRILREWTPVCPVSACALLIMLAGSATAQQAPAMSAGAPNLKLTIGECEQRVEGAFRSVGYAVNGGSGDQRFGRHAEFQAYVKCVLVPDGNAWAIVVVAGNSAQAGTNIERDRLERAIQSPSSVSSANNGGNVSRVPFSSFSFSPTSGRVGYHLVSKLNEPPNDRPVPGAACAVQPSEMTTSEDLPPGLSTTRTQTFYTIEGTPTQAGDWSIQVTFHDVKCSVGSDRRNYGDRTFPVNFHIDR